MTALKCLGVKTPSFANLQRYIERDGKCMGRRCLNIANEAEWSREMDETAMIENVAERSKTRGYHMVIAFNPDEVRPRLADGRVDKARFAWCLDYAEEFCQRQMPGMQCAMGAHLERSDADNKERIAIHVVVNRPVISDFDYPDREGHVAREGTLFDRSPSVRRAQVECIRKLDADAGLSQLRRGPNVESHRVRGRTGKEREMAERRGVAPWKELMREAVVRSVERSRSMEEFEASMRSLGFGLDLAHSKGNITVRDGSGHRARISTLGVTRSRIEEIFANREAVREMATERVERVEAERVAALHRPQRRERIEERHQAIEAKRVAIAERHQAIEAKRVAIPHLRPTHRLITELGRLARLARERTAALAKEAARRIEAERRRVVQQARRRAQEINHGFGMGR